MSRFIDDKTKQTIGVTNGYYAHEACAKAHNYPFEVDNWKPWGQHLHPREGSRCEICKQVMVPVDTHDLAFTAF